MCVVDCEQTGQWKDCVRSIFMWHRFSRHVRTQRAEDDEAEKTNIQRQEKK